MSCTNLPEQEKNANLEDVLLLPTWIRQDVFILSNQKNYALVAKALKEFVDKKDLCKCLNEKMISDFKKKDAKNLDLSKYYITRDFGCGYSKKFNIRFGNEPSCRYYDAPYTFVLCHKEEKSPLASISFEADTDAILVRQIQGVKGQKEKLKPIKWARMLLTLVCEFAAQNEISKVKLTPYVQSSWTEVQSNGKMTYDVTAKNCKFKYDSSSKKYVKQIKSEKK